MGLDQTWANYGPPVLLFWPAGTSGNLNSHHELSERPFSSFKDHEWLCFLKSKPQRCKIEIKNEVKTLYFGDHVRTWTEISKTKKKVFTLFYNQRAARGFNSFSKFGLLCAKFAHLWTR